MYLAEAQIGEGNIEQAKNVLHCPLAEWVFT